jgi:hypothetical protein
MKTAGWIVILLAALVTRQSPQDGNVYVTADGKRCPPQGDDAKPAIIALDVQKNRVDPPAPAQVDADASLAAILAPGNDVGRFDPTKGATITGIVVRVKEGSSESCNCHASNPIDKDTHIELALSANAPPNQRMVVEVTPRLRKQMKAMGKDWSTAALQGEQGSAGIVGKWVRVGGWLFFDEIHIGISENTNPGAAHNVRATCWEIHPVTSLEVSDTAPAGAHELDPGLLAQLQKGHQKTLAASPVLRDELGRHRTAVLSKYGAETIREADAEAQLPPRPEETRKAQSPPPAQPPGTPQP